MQKCLMLIEVAGKHMLKLLFIFIQTIYGESDFYLIFV